MAAKKRGKKNNRHFIFKNHHSVFRTRLTIGQRAADIVTRVCGSWIFIISILILIAIWMTMNVYMIIYKWDPYPFILLNFVLSCLAAMQAPIILMSQNRQQERDRMKLDYDFRINKKSLSEVEKIHKELREMSRFIRRK